MSSRYQKAFTIPDGFPMILKQFTREVRAAAPPLVPPPRPPRTPTPRAPIPIPKCPNWHANPLPAVRARRERFD